MSARALLLLLAALACLGPRPAAAQTLTLYEAPPMVSQLHPFRLAESPQGLHVSALTTLRLAGVDVATNTLTLRLFLPPPEGPARELILSLRPGLRFSDGSPLTARDVAESFGRLDAWAAAPDAPRSVAALRRSLFLVTAMEATGPTTLVVRFSAAVRGSELPALLAALPVVPAAVDDARLGAPGAPTLGPYVLTAIEGDLARFEANPHCPLGAPHIPRVEVVVAEDDALSAALAQPGSAEVALHLPMDGQSLSPDLSLRRAPTRRFAYLGFNRRPGSRFAAEPGLREVVEDLVDRGALLDILAQDDLLIAPSTSPFAPGTPLSPDAPPERGSVVEAEARLAALGYQRVGESWRDARDEPLRLRLVVHTAVPAGELVGRLVADQLSRLGIPVTVTLLDAEAFRALLAEPRGDYDLILHEWMLDESEDLTELYASGARYNYLGYAAPEVDRRLALERRAQLPSSRRLYRAELLALFQRDPPALILWQRQDVIAVRSDVLGVPPLDPYFLLRDVERWHLDGQDDGADAVPGGAP